jgi:F-type H+-transporting ATPase subunit delta
MPIEPATKPLHPTVLDVTEEQVARVYAKGFLGAVERLGDVEGLIDELESIVAQVLDRHPRFEKSFAPAFMSPEDRMALLDRVFGSRVARPVLNLLKVLSAHGRLASLRSVVRQVRLLFNKMIGRIEVNVRTAMQLEDDVYDALRDALHRQLGIQPILQVAVDPEVLGGVVIKVGDTVYDGSIRTMFEKARRSMVDRAVEMIEMKPHVFVHQN